MNYDDDEAGKQKSNEDDEFSKEAIDELLEETDTPGDVGPEDSDEQENAW